MAEPIVRHTQQAPRLGPLGVARKSHTRAQASLPQAGAFPRQATADRPAIAYLPKRECLVVESDEEPTRAADHQLDSGVVRAGEVFQSGIQERRSAPPSTRKSWPSAAGQAPVPAVMQSYSRAIPRGFAPAQVMTGPSSQVIAIRRSHALAAHAPRFHGFEVMIAAFIVFLVGAAAALGIEHLVARVHGNQPTKAPTVVVESAPPRATAKHARPSKAAPVSATVAPATLKVVSNVQAQQPPQARTSATPAAPPPAARPAPQTAPVAARAPARAAAPSRPARPAAPAKAASANPHDPSFVFADRR